MHRAIIRVAHGASARIASRLAIMELARDERTTGRSIARVVSIPAFVVRRTEASGPHRLPFVHPSRRFAMTYVDGFVAAVPTANRDAFRRHAAAAAVVFREHGALSVAECWGDDVPEGKVTSFPMAVQRKDDETVVFSWITWPSREARDAGMKKVMADPRLQPETNPMPFDGKRMIYGGFEMIVSA
jgi:uncharacterized protein YbaA (DUF1428 family)